MACTKHCADALVGERVFDPRGGGAPSPPKLNGRIIVADSWTAQGQQILEARPDLVIASVPYPE